MEGRQAWQERMGIRPEVAGGRGDAMDGGRMIDAILACGEGLENGDHPVIFSCNCGAQGPQSYSSQSRDERLWIYCITGKFPLWV